MGEVAKLTVTQSGAAWFDGDYTVDTVPMRDAAECFERARPYLERAAAFAPLDLIDWDDARLECQKGNALLLQVAHGQELVAYAYLEMRRGSQGDALTVRWLGGVGMREWLGLLWESLQDIARAYGCRWVVVSGRRGWRKTLAPLGFRDAMWTGSAEVN
jgi:hypothetical protein